MRVAHLHGCEVRCGLRARELELFDDIRNLFETMHISMRSTHDVRYDQKSRTLEQNELIRLAYLRPKCNTSLGQRAAPRSLAVQVRPSGLPRTAVRGVIVGGRDWE